MSTLPMSHGKCANVCTDLGITAVTMPTRTVSEKTSPKSFFNTLSCSAHLSTEASACFNSFTSGGALLHRQDKRSSRLGVVLLVQRLSRLETVHVFYCTNARQHVVPAWNNRSYISVEMASVSNPSNTATISSSLTSFVACPACACSLYAWQFAERTAPLIRRRIAVKRRALQVPQIQNLHATRSRSSSRGDRLLGLLHLGHSTDGGGKAATFAASTKRTVLLPPSPNLQRETSSLRYHVSGHRCSYQTAYLTHQLLNACFSSICISASSHHSTQSARITPDSSTMCIAQLAHSHCDCFSEFHARAVVGLHQSSP